MKSRIMQRVLVMFAGLGLVLGAAACSQTATDTSAPASSSTPAADLRVTGVDLGRSVGGDKRVTEKAETFGPNDVIYASVLTAGAAPNATLKARWTFEDGQVVEESEQMIAPTGDAATEFHISKPDGWPAGKYQLEVFLNGSSVGSEDFEVRS